uniref:Uncharacterized protein n=1 Tax=Strombidinopsis acuminata TaxID=141414 RepID=A0A7S3RJC9_9SPIT|mmetsp:Transcript_63911/g.164510  ORF Transcript_63911/g.164510 Transcript_63911/m.164510 type:complete len:154 (+) Transcript_63911:68-529(+)
MAQRRNRTAGVCLILAASLFGLTAFVQPLAGRPVAGERVASSVAMKASAQQKDAEGASWSLPVVGAAALSFVLLMGAPAAQAMEGKKIEDKPGTRQWAVQRDVTYEIPGESSLDAKLSKKTMNYGVTAQKNEDVTKAVEGIEGPKPSKVATAK